MQEPSSGIAVVSERGHDLVVGFENVVGFLQFCRDGVRVSLLSLPRGVHDKSLHCLPLFVALFVSPVLVLINELLQGGTKGSPPHG